MKKGDKTKKETKKELSQEELDAMVKEAIEKTTDSNEKEAIDTPTEDATELEKCQQKCNDLNDKNLRLMAEFDNFRKRTLKEKSDLIKAANERLFLDMLPVIDDLDRALSNVNNATEIEAIKEGMQLIHSKLVTFLSDNNLKEIPTENEIFDEEKHEAVTTFPTPNSEDKGKIIDCVSKGYSLNDKVIRYPKVVVGE